MTYVYQREYKITGIKNITYQINNNKTIKYNISILISRFAHLTYRSHECVLI